MKKLIVVSAPSGAGKTTLCRYLLGDFPTLVLSISTTTRAPRGSEKNGVDYFFVSQEEFQSEIQAGRFAEWALVHGNYYGTSKKVIEDAFKAGKSVLLDIDVQGAASLRKTYPQECLSIFITPPSVEELEKRLRLRKTDAEETIQKRIKNARTELDHAPHFHKTVVNDELERAYGELKAWVAEQLASEECP